MPGAPILVGFGGSNPLHLPVFPGRRFLDRNFSFGAFGCWMTLKASNQKDICILPNWNILCSAATVPSSHTCPYSKNSQSAQCSNSQSTPHPQEVTQVLNESMAPTPPTGSFEAHQSRVYQKNLLSHFKNSLCCWENRWEAECNKFWATAEILTNMEFRGSESLDLRHLQP